MSTEITQRDIFNAGNKVNWDVCQLGLVLAEKFSKTQDEYNDIWRAAQEVFGDKMMGRGYNVKLSKRHAFARQLLNFINQKKHIGLAKKMEW